jgi:elongation factor P
MINANELHTGSVIKLEGGLFRIFSAEYHSGGPQSGKMLHMKGRNIKTGHIKEWKFKPDEKLEVLNLQRQEWEFLYEDGDILYFMDPLTFEQIALERELIGHAQFLLPNMRVQVESYEGKVIHVIFPSLVELMVVSAPEVHREHDSATFKKVTLENGMEILVPQFIRSGEYVRVDSETGKYVERATF